MVRHRYRFFALMAGFILMGLVGQPAHAAMYWMDDQTETTALKPAFTGAGQEPMVTTGTVRIEDTFAGPGESTVKMPVTLINTSSDSAAGLQFDLDFSDVENATITDIIIDDDIASLGFQLKTNEDDGGSFSGLLRVVIFSTNGARIPSGERTVAWICFTADDIPPVPGPLGTEDPVKVVPGSVIVSDQNGGVIGDNNGVDGLLQVGIAGDVNLDGQCDVRDVVILVRAILDENFPPEGSAGAKIHDINEDDAINVADAIGIVNKILGLDILDGVSKVVGSPITVNLGPTVLQSDGQLVVPVLLNAESLVAGVQATFTFDPDVLSVGTPFVGGNASHLLIDSNISDNGTVQVIVISLSRDQGLNAGATPMLLLPVTLLADREATISLTGLILSNRHAQVLPVTLGTVEQTFTKDVLAPTAFALKNAAPNPFNPTTTISYDVPQQAHITLVVYNMLGQEVVRLVDQVQTAGRYTVVWNARNTNGLQVASGVYLYRITSSTGFSDVKRMTLLK